ncbi:MAG: Na+/H+ antiporter subunit G [Chloroflexi bacterium]|nr:MAG: Na+/H+ antiporter subunit G [Chloroflexota bacterium]
MEVQEWTTLTVATIGVLIMLLSSIGVWRLPDVFMRMHAFGKAATMGISCLMIAAGIYYPDYLARMIVLVILFFITGPIATTAMARAAYRVATPAEKFVLKYDEMGRDALRAEVQQE